MPIAKNTMMTAGELADFLSRKEFYTLAPGGRVKKVKREEVKLIVTLEGNEEADGWSMSELFRDEEEAIAFLKACVNKEVDVVALSRRVMGIPNLKETPSLSVVLWRNRGLNLEFFKASEREAFYARAVRTGFKMEIKDNGGGFVYVYKEDPDIKTVEISPLKDKESVKIYAFYNRPANAEVKGGDGAVRKARKEDEEE